MESRNLYSAAKCPGSNIPRPVSTSSISSILSETDVRANNYLTPLSSGQRRTAMTSIMGTAKRSDPKSIFDKEWQRYQSDRVCNFLRTVIDDPEALCRDLEQRQLRISSFINIINILLTQTKICDNSAAVTNTNYLEKLPVILKKLHYRGQITRSLMTTVNTSHSWPHVLSMFAFIIDIHDSMHKADFIDEFFDADNPDRRLFFELSVKKAPQNKTMEQDDDAEFEQKIFDTLLESRGCSINDMNDLQEEIQHLEADLCNAEFEKKCNIYKSQFNRCKELENDLVSLLELKKKANAEIEENEAQIQKYKSKSANQCKEIDVLKAELSRIDDLLQNQLHSKKDLIELKAEEVELEAMLIKKREKIEHLRSISDSDDLKVIRLRSSIHNTISDYNNNLVEPCLSRPQLKALLLPENGVNYTELKTAIEDARAESNRDNIWAESTRQEDNRKRQMVDEKEEALCKLVEKKKSEMIDLNDQCNRLTEKIKDQDKQIEERFKSSLKDEERHKDILTELDLIFQNYCSRIGDVAEIRILEIAIEIGGGGRQPEIDNNKMMLPMDYWGPIFDQIGVENGSKKG